MKNKKIADRLLIVLLFLFLIIVALRIYCSNGYYMKLLSFVLEAALVGGIADWFAITALFKKPLGFPWHTAIIPRNRDKVIAAIAGMVENELLSPNTLRRKISEINIIDGIIVYLESNEELEDAIFRGVEKYGTRFLDNIKTKEIAEYIEKELKDKLIELDLSTYLGRLLSFAVKSDECEKMFSIILEEMIVKIKQESTRDGINEIINDVIEENLSKASGFKRVLLELALGVAKDTNSINTVEISSSIQEQVAILLNGLKDENDQEHIEMLAKIENAAYRLQNDSKVIENVEAWKCDTISKIKFGDDIDEIINNIVNAFKFSIRKDNLQNNKVFLENGKVQSIETMYKDNAVLIASWVRNQLKDYWDDFKRNEAAKKIIDRYIKEAIFKVIKAEHSFIGITVKNVLNNMTDDSLNEFINVKAGNDLHWIRINGCMVGAIFGLFVYVFVNIIYLPIISRIFGL